MTHQDEHARDQGNKSGGGGCSTKWTRGVGGLLCVGGGGGRGWVLRGGCVVL